MYKPQLNTAIEDLSSTDGGWSEGSSVLAAVKVPVEKAEACI